MPVNEPPKTLRATLEEQSNAEKMQKTGKTVVIGKMEVGEGTETTEETMKTERVRS